MGPAKNCLPVLHKPMELRCFPLLSLDLLSFLGSTLLLSSQLYLIMALMAILMVLTKVT